MDTTTNELPSMSTPPVPPEYAFPSVLETPNNWHNEMGITVRDYFAARIIEAMVHDLTEFTLHSDEGAEVRERATRAAYGLADLMMEARKSQP